MTSSQPFSLARDRLSRRAALRRLGLFGAATLISPALLRATATAASTDTAPAATAPSLAGAQPGFYRFKIGAIEALAVNDGGFAMPPADSPFGIGEPREKVTAALADALAPTDLVRLPFNVLVARIGSELVMVDSGCGPAFGDAGGKLVANLAAAGVKPEQITAIVLSHLHGDHFGGLLDAQGQPVFPRAQLFMHKTEHAYWTEKGDASVQKYLHAFEGKWQLVAGGEKLLGGLEIVETFGHTPGHVAVALTSGNEQLFHFVDVGHSHVLSFAHPEWVMQYDVQKDVAIATRRRVFDRLASDKARVFGAHMPFPALGRVRRAGSAYEYLIEPWVV